MPSKPIADCRVPVAAAASWSACRWSQNQRGLGWLTDKLAGVRRGQDAALVVDALFIPSGDSRDGAAAVRC